MIWNSFLEDDKIFSMILIFIYLLLGISNTNVYAKNSVSYLFPEVATFILNKKELKMKFDLRLGKDKSEVIFDRINQSENQKEGGRIIYNNDKHDHIKRLFYKSDRPSSSGENDSNYSLIKTATFKDDKVDSYTECDYSVANSNENNLLKEILIAYEKMEMTGSCYTISKAICTEINKNFSTNGLETILKKLNKCTDLTKKIKKAVTQNYYTDEDKAQMNIHFISSEYREIYPISKDQKRDWKKIFNNLARGERSKPTNYLIKLGKMLGLCEKVDFYSSYKGEKNFLEKAKVQKQ